MDNQIQEKKSSSSSAITTGYAIGRNSIVKSELSKADKSVSFQPSDRIKSSFAESSGSVELQKHSRYGSTDKFGTTSQVKLNLSSNMSLKMNSLSSIGILNKQSHLENIAEVEDEREIVSPDNYYGWDDGKAKDEDGIKHNENQLYEPKCIPPWAKTFRKVYDMSPSHSFNEENHSEVPVTKIQEKLKSLIKKHDDLMLVKRVESRKQLTFEPGKCNSDMETVRMKLKNTRYYMTPINKQELENEISPPDVRDKQKLSFSGSNDSSISDTKKTSKYHAKQEVSKILKTLYTKPQKNTNESHREENKSIRDRDKCQKVTLNKIREYVNARAMDPDERKLHEIIKVETVPSFNMQQDRGKPSSKYIINIPNSKQTDAATINVIKIKEKHKLRVHNIEDVNEKTTELHWEQNDPKRHNIKERKQNHDDPFGNEIDPYIKKKIKSSKETKSFEVKSKQTPIITPLVDQSEKKTDNLLLIQYEHKSKPTKTESTERIPLAQKTKVLGMKQISSGDVEEGYLYSSETKGTRVRENVTKVEDIPASLKRKVNMIFQELRDLTLQKGIQQGVQSSQVQVCPTVSAKAIQHSSSLAAVTTGVANVQAGPEVKSEEVQVQQSHLMPPSGPSRTLPHPSPTITYLAEEVTTVDEAKLGDTLQKTLTDQAPPDENVLDTSDLRRTLSSEALPKDDLDAEEKIVKQHLYSEINEFSEKVSESVLMDEKKSVEEKSFIEQEFTKQVPEHGQISIADTEKIENEQNIEKVDEEEKFEELSLNDKVQGTQEKNKEENEYKIEKLYEEETSLKESVDSMTLKPESKIIEYKPSYEEIETDLNYVEHIKEISDEEIKQELKTVDSDISIPTKIIEEIHLPLVKEEDIEEEIPFSDHIESIRASRVSFALPDDIEEDIRSYEFDSYQGTELKLKSSSKFIHKKESIRKKMNWTADTMFLEQNTCPQLIRGLVETAERRPADPIAFLAHWIYKNYQSQETEEKDRVWQEHLSLARTMRDVKHGDTQQLKKFKLINYPVKSSSTSLEKTDTHVEMVT